MSKVLASTYDVNWVPRLKPSTVNMAAKHLDLFMRWLPTSNTVFSKRALYWFNRKYNKIW